MIATVAPSVQTRARALLELRRREREHDRRIIDARSNLIDFVQFTYPHYTVDPFHRLLAATLDRVMRGEIKRLMVFAPPQHGKSQLVSVHLPAFWLGCRPNESVIITSYAADLAKSKSREARSIVEGQEFAELFPGVQTNPYSRAVNLWQLAPPHRGQLVAAGVDGPVTGHGAHLAIIDDPFETWKEAQSQTMRDHADEWFKGTFRTRLRKGGAIIIVNTRWHVDDLSGRLISRDRNGWTILRLPAIAESQEVRDVNNKFLGLPLGEDDPLGRAPGEPLAPSRYDVPELESIKADVGSMVWGAAYDGVPRPAEGNRFKRAWFTRIVTSAPRAARRVRYWDKAGTEGGNGAATAGVMIALGDDGTVYVEHVVQGWYSSAEREAVIKATAEMDAAKYDNAVEIWVEQEPGSSGKESSEATLRNLIGFPVSPDRPTGDKDTRLEPFRTQAENGRVALVFGTWNEPYIDELCAIPNGARRDQGDASAGALAKVSDGQTIRAGAAPSVIAEYRG